MARLKGKFENLERLVSGKLKSDTVLNSEELEQRYSDIEGQMRQHLNLLREEHRNKLTIITEMEAAYKDKITAQNRNLHFQDEMEAIEKRGKLEGEILLMQK
jgi:hypothetical protein